MRAVFEYIGVIHRNLSLQNSLKKIIEGGGQRNDYGEWGGVATIFQQLVTFGLRWLR